LDEKPVLPFHEMGLDDRLLKAVAKLGWSEPTPIQERAIPLALEGKDLLARGRTGSGKTAAFALPLVQRVLHTKANLTEGGQCVRALVLAPSRELCSQIHQVLLALTDGCKRDVRCLNVASVAENENVALIATADILVGTPSRVLAHIKACHLDPANLEFLVIDEADLVFSFGYEEDVRAILRKLPSVYQAVLTSATLTPDVEQLRKLVLHNPVILRLEDDSQLPPDSQLTQYQIKIEEEDKFVLIYALFKLRLIRGKSVVFVNGVDRCYKLKLYLEQFHIPVCVLNSELPAATRCHIVGQFNQGIYDVIVASDEKFLEEAPAKADDEGEDGIKKGKKRDKKVDKDKERSKRVKDKESGVARGIDFQFVSNVINFDFPTDPDSYVHRVGRTARGNNKGTALSLVAGKEMDSLARVEERLREQLARDDDEDATILKPYRFKMDELDGFRYRARDAWRAVTKIAVREARLKELKREILASERLRAHLEENPRDAVALRHDKALHTVKQQPQLRSVPEYIVPRALRRGKKRAAPSTGGAPPPGTRIGKKKMSAAKRKYEMKKADPLRNLRK